MNILILITAALFPLITFADTITLDASKPIYLRLEAQGIGPEIQCYYGSTGPNDYVYGVMTNDAPIAKDETFVGTFKFSLSSSIKLDTLRWGSKVACWVINDHQPLELGRTATISVEIYQTENVILFKDSFQGMIRYSAHADLWVTPPHPIRFVEAVIQ